MKERKPTVGIITQGCKVNQYESAAITEAFSQNGFSVRPPHECCDVYVINTCTVTAESDRKAGQLVRRVAAKNKNAYILVLGCFSQSSPAAVAALGGVDAVLGNTNKLAVVEITKQLLAGGQKRATPIMAVGDVNSAPFEAMQITRFDRTRAYVKIEDGCENRCAYCAIPAARGRVRSKPMDDVIKEVEGLVKGGCREIVLTGIETASYGRDLDGANLAALLEAVDKIEGIGRIRLGSLDPSLMRADFVARLAALRHLAPHFHLSVQSGSSRVLAAMKRKYNAVQAMDGIKRLRAAIPHVQLTADFIVGFPTESDADFADTLAFAREADFLHMHVFAYSRRTGTVAAEMSGQVPERIKKERSAALISLGEDIKRDILKKALETPLREVLFETYRNGVATGHTPDFLEVRTKSDVPLHSAVLPVRLNGIEDGVLTAEIL